MLDVSFPLLAKVLGSEDDPLESITVPHLLAISYAGCCRRKTAST